MDEDKVIKKLIEHDTRFDTMLTKQEFVDFKEAYFKGQDKMIVILERLDQERVFTNQIISRMQTELEEQKKQIGEHDRILQRVKVELKIA